MAEKTLQKQLRDVHKIRRDQTPLDLAVSMCHEAADELDRLTAQRDDALNALIRERAQAAEASYGRQVQIDRLTAQLTEAREALRYIIVEAETGHLAKVQESARTALAAAEQKS